MSDVEVIERPPDLASTDGQADDLACPDCEWAPKATWPRGIRSAHLTRHRVAKHNYVVDRSKPKPTAKAGAERSPKVTPPKTAAPAPARRPRKSAAKWLSMTWGLGSGFVPGRGGGIMAWETPAAGAVLDRALAGTIVDRVVLQRVAAEEDRWGDLANLVMLPLIGVILDRAPAAAGNPFIRGFAQAAISDMIEAQLDAELAALRELERLNKKAQAVGRSDVAAAVSEVMGALFGDHPETEDVPVVSVE